MKLLTILFGILGVKAQHRYLTGGGGGDPDLPMNVIYTHQTDSGVDMWDLAHLAFENDNEVDSEYMKTQSNLFF